MLFKGYCYDWGRVTQSTQPIFMKLCEGVTHASHMGEILEKGGDV